MGDGNSVREMGTIFDGGSKFYPSCLPHFGNSSSRAILSFSRLNSPTPSRLMQSEHLESEPEHPEHPEQVEHPIHVPFHLFRVFHSYMACSGFSNLHRLAVIAFPTIHFASMTYLIRASLFHCSTFSGLWSGIGCN